MQVISAASRHLETSQAVVQVLEQVQGALSGADPDLLCLFVTAEHAERFPVIVRSLRDIWPAACLVGCGASSVIGGGHEVERGPAISLLAIQWANAHFTAFHLTEEQLSEAAANPSALVGPLTGGDREPACLMLLADPFSPGAAALLPSLDRALPTTPVIGGVASGTNTPGTTCLTADGQTHREGVAGVSISGELEVATLVTQGCRPIGAPLFVTSASEQAISTLDGRPPMDILQELFEAGDRRERALLQSSLFLGIQMEAGRSEYQQGDFLIRNLTGVDEERGAISVAGDVQPNGVVQFHVRDAHTASEDLELALRSQTRLRERLHGALLFSCLGRGEGLYGVPDHDSDRLRERLGTVPISGFFGNGEIGPVGGRTHLHAYTSAFGLLCAPA